MKTKTKILFACLLAVIANQAASSAMASDNKDADDVAAQLIAFDDAWNKCDLKTLAALFTDGATMITDDAAANDSMGMDFKGKTAIMEHLKFMLNGPMKGSLHKMTPRFIQVVSADVAIGDGRIEVGGMKDLPPIRAKGTAVLAKVKGKWLFAAVRAFVHMPAPPAAAAPVVRK